MRGLLRDSTETLERPIDQRTGYPGVTGRIEQSLHVRERYFGFLERVTQRPISP